MGELLRYEISVTQSTVAERDETIKALRKEVRQLRKEVSRLEDYEFMYEELTE